MGNPLSNFVSCVTLSLTNEPAQANLLNLAGNLWGYGGAVSNDLGVAKRSFLATTATATAIIAGFLLLIGASETRPDLGAYGVRNPITGTKFATWIRHSRPLDLLAGILRILYSTNQLCQTWGRAQAGKKATPKGIFGTAILPNLGGVIKAVSVGEFKTSHPDSTIFHWFNESLW